MQHDRIAHSVDSMIVGVDSSSRPRQQPVIRIQQGPIARTDRPLNLH